MRVSSSAARRARHDNANRGTEPPLRGTGPDDFIFGYWTRSARRPAARALHGELPRRRHYEAEMVRLINPDAGPQADAVSPRAVPVQRPPSRPACSRYMWAPSVRRGSPGSSLLQLHAAGLVWPTTPDAVPPGPARHLVRGRRRRFRAPPRRAGRALGYASATARRSRTVDRRAPAAAPLVPGRRQLDAADRSSGAVAGAGCDPSFHAEPPVRLRPRPRSPSRRAPALPVRRLERARHPARLGRLIVAGGHFNGKLTARAWPAALGGPGVGARPDIPSDQSTR